MKITEWVLACKDNQKIYYEDYGVAWFWGRKSVLRYNARRNKFEVDYMMDRKYLCDLFVSEKECALEHIKKVEEDYINTDKVVPNNID